MPGEQCKMVLLSGAMVLSLAGCDRPPVPASQPGSSPVPTRPVLTLIDPAGLTWSREEACAKLADPASELAAAIRLTQLAPVDLVWMSPAWTDDGIRRLRLLRVDDERWALGLAEPEGPRCLRAPAVIMADGEVQPLADGTDAELLVLYGSEDTDLFPHLLLWPDRVALLTDKVESAITLRQRDAVRFALRTRNQRPYVGLVLVAAPQQEVARYTWDVYEAMFFGPAADALPDPPGGRFEIDLKASPRLVPVGGELPPPQENVPLPEPPDDAPPGERWAAGAGRALGSRSRATVRNGVTDVRTRSAGERT